MNNKFNQNNGSQFSQFKSPSSYNPNFANFNKAFNPMGTMIPYNTYNKPKGLIHDNVENEVLDEVIDEKRVRINSYDRDTSAYLDPFEFVVKFNPQSQTIYKDPSTGVKSTIQGDPGPMIRPSFRNVKYIRLDNITLPTYADYDEEDLATTDFLNTDLDALDWTKVKITKTDGTTMDIKAVVEADAGVTITTENVDLVIDYINDELIDSALITLRSDNYDDENPDPLISRTQITRLYDVTTDIDFYFDVDAESWKIYRPDTTSFLYDDLYVALDIEEFRHSHTYGTSQKLEDAFSLIYPYKQISYFFYEGATHDGIIHFKHSDLKNINKFTIKFFNSHGTQIKFDHLSRNAVSTKDSRHPANKSIQCHMTFSIGVVEATHNRRANYSR